MKEGRTTERGMAHERLATKTQRRVRRPGASAVSTRRLPRKKAAREMRPCAISGETLADSRIRARSDASARVKPRSQNAWVMKSSTSDSARCSAARALGCGFALVDPLPTGERPTGLRDGLRDLGAPL